jgi:hypothetical protein
MLLPVRVFPENRLFNFLPFTPCPAVAIFEKIIVKMMHTNKTLQLEINLYTILQIFSLTLFEKTPLDQLLMNYGYNVEKFESSMQLNLFDNLTG